MVKATACDVRRVGESKAGGLFAEAKAMEETSHKIPQS